jgi:hypothetical protein
MLPSEENDFFIYFKRFYLPYSYRHERNALASRGFKIFFSQ